MDGFRATWDNPNLDITHGYIFRRRLTIERPEDAGYVVTGHTARLRLRARGADSDALEHPLNPVATPTLETIDGVPNVLVAVFELILAPSQTASLTRGESYNYVVDFTDSRGETRAEKRGMIYVGRSI